MKIRSTPIALVLFLSGFLSVKAQDAPKAGQSMSLEQCIDYALKNNIQVKQSELNTEITQINLTQSEANLLPSLNANGSHSYNTGNTVDRFTNQFHSETVLSQNFSLSSDITVFNGLQTINSIKEYKYNYSASRFDVDKMKNDISLNIASAYLQILYNSEALDNARNQMNITKGQVDRTQKLLEAGSAAKGTLLDIQAQFSSEELNVTVAQNQLDISYLTLAQLMNLPTAEGLSIVKPELTVGNDVLLTANATQIYNTAVGNLPEIKSAELKVKGAEKAVDVAWGGLSPRLSFSASYGTGYSGASQRLLTQPAFTGFSPNGSFAANGLNADTVYSPTFSSPTYEKKPFSDQYKDNVNKSFGFYLTVPIFNRFQTKSTIDKAKIQKLNAELTVESTKLQIQKNIQQAYADASGALKKYAGTQKTLEAMQESFKYTEQKFNVGMVNTTDYNTAKNKLIKTQSDLLQAKYEYVFKTKVLDFYQGKPLKF
jgi:outer membrane protein